MATKRLTTAAGVVLFAALATLSERAQAAGPFQYHAITPCRIADSRLSPANPPGTNPAASRLTTGNYGCRDAWPCQENGATVPPTATSPPSGFVPVVFYRMRGNCGVPTAAKAISGNFTIVNPGAAGYIRMYPYNAADAALPMPLTATLLFSASETIGNGAIVPVGTLDASPNPDLAIYINASGTNADLVVDVTGYFCDPGAC